MARMQVKSSVRLSKVPTIRAAKLLGTCTLGCVFNSDTLDGEFVSLINGIRNEEEGK